MLAGRCYCTSVAYYECSSSSSSSSGNCGVGEANVLMVLPGSSSTLHPCRSGIRIGGGGGGGGIEKSRCDIKDQQRRRSMTLLPAFGSKSIFYSGMCRCLANFGMAGFISTSQGGLFRSQIGAAEPWNHDLGFGSPRTGALRKVVENNVKWRGNASFLTLHGTGAVLSFPFWRPEVELRIAEVKSYAARTLCCAPKKQPSFAGNQACGNLDSSIVKDAEVPFRHGWSKKGWRRRRKQGQIAKASSRNSVESTEEQVQKVEKEEEAVVVVESPAKARTIGNYLGGNFVVLASYGHVRDLAARSGSVRPQEDFAMLWEVPSSAQTHINSIKNALKRAKCLVLASDPDREGEAIAWHILEMLKMDGFLKNGLKVKRVTFHEITKPAIERAMALPRDISETLVNAYLARRALDYLIGFDLSPLLWRKLPGSKSAGRVQSAALSLICDRESEIELFSSQEYWTVQAELYKASQLSQEERVNADDIPKGSFMGKLTHFKGNKLVQFSFVSLEEAKLAAQAVSHSKLKVSIVKKNFLRRNAPLPYITSTLQQVASNKLSFGASRTMALAQHLYEGVKLPNNEIAGLITYMRTDSHQISSEAVHSIRVLAAERYGQEYVPSQARTFTIKVKNAQEAHEAIRPTDIFRLPSTLVDVLERDALRLYALIWSRTVACQMEQAIFNQVAIDSADESGNVRLRSTCSSNSFLGYLAVFQDKEALLETPEELEKEKDELSTKISQLEVGDLLLASRVEPHQHFTEPPPRFTEGSLVKKMEELGIGRPSTYASTLKTLETRSYMKVEKGRIFPEIRGRMVAAFLAHYFPDFINYRFTAKMEGQLDEVSTGRADWKDILKLFWAGFHERVSSTMKVSSEQVREILEGVFAEKIFSGLGSKGRTCPSCGQGELSLKLSRYGAGFFFGCNQYPTCLYKTNVLLGEEDSPMQVDEASTLITQTQQSTHFLGVDPKTGLQVNIKVGPFGPYIQLGEATKKQKPKRSSVPKTLRVENIDLDTALEMLEYPKELGKHPKDGAAVIISIGPYGYFLRHRARMAPIAKDIAPKETSLEKAVELLDGRNASKRGRKVKTQVEESVTREPPVEKPLLDLSRSGKKSNNSKLICEESLILKSPTEEPILKSSKKGSKVSKSGRVLSGKVESKLPEAAGPKRSGRQSKGNPSNELSEDSSIPIQATENKSDDNQISANEIAPKRGQDTKSIEKTKPKQVCLRKQNKVTTPVSVNRNAKTKTDGQPVLDLRGMEESEPFESVAQVGVR